MRVDLLVPDAAVPQGPGTMPAPAASKRANPFGALVDAAGTLLDNADVAEAQFTAHKGGLQEMVVERARADIALQVAATAAQRSAQALQTLLGMQL